MKPPVVPSRAVVAPVMRLLGAALLVLVTVAGAQEPGPGAGSPLDIGSKLELMVDDYLVESLTGSAESRLHHPIAREIAIRHDEPWEGSGCNYHTVFRDGDVYRLYYRGAQFTVKDGKLVQDHRQVTCYAESKDGIHWEKPSLGIFEFEGSKDNNIVWANTPGTHNFAPFKDANPNTPEDQRYKALGSAERGGGLAAFGSADGIHWRLLTKKPVITEGAFDSQNLAFWDETRGEYRAYYRDFRGGNRDILTATSRDFLTWTEGEWLEYPGAARAHLYTNQIQPYYRAPHLFVGLPARYVERKDLDPMRGLPDAEHRELRAAVMKRYGTALSDTVLMTSRDGLHFHRWDEAFIYPGPERAGTWNYGHLFTAHGMVETAPAIEGMPDELSLYSVEGSWTDQESQLRRYTMRIDGFSSIHASGTAGELLTKPLVFAGGELVLNFATSAAGQIKIAVQDVDQQEIPGFGIADSVPLFGDSLERKVTWKGNPDLSKLAGRPVRLRFVLKEADLYSLRFREKP